MKKRNDMFINYEKTYKNRRRGSRRIFHILLVVLIAIILGITAYIVVKAFINSRYKSNTDTSEYTKNRPDNNNEYNNDQNQQDIILSSVDETVINPSESSIWPTTGTAQVVAPTVDNPDTDTANADTATSDTTAADYVDTHVTDKSTIISPTLLGAPVGVATKHNPVKVKGLYVTASSASSKRMEDLIKLVDKTEINSIVIDVKDDHGKITYDMNSTTAREIGATTNKIPDIHSFVESLKSRDIYLIARIVAFKDPYLTQKRQELAVKNNDGTIYLDNNGDGWINPYNRKVWDYLVEVAIEAADDGFDEVQFDYIRFSTGSGISKADFGEESKTVSRMEIITEFTKYIYEKIKPHGVYVSADVYGTIISSSVDASLVGQDYTEMAKHLDYICPMIYPSHFAEGNYGIKYPDKEPYNIIKKVLTASSSKLALIPQGEHKAIVRPWLQAFSATWIKHYKKYGSDEIREQIEGVYNTGYDEWLLWNAASVYSEDALLEE